MYLKNDSNFQCGLRTKKEVLTIKPGEKIQVLDSDIIQLNSKLKQITEAEFNEVSEKKEIKREIKEHKEEPKVEVVVEVPKEEVIEATDEQKEDNELITLNKTLEELKAKWEAATKPRRKEQLQKQMIEIQAQINKIKE